MLGRRSPQMGLFDAQTLPHCVPADSFHGRMAAISDQLFRDDDLAAMYDPSTGRPSLPPSFMCGVMLLQHFHDISDDEAVQGTMFDLRWKVALRLPLDFPGFHPSSLSVFRRRCLEHGQERYAFDRFIQVARAAGFLPDRVTLLTDTTSVGGAGAVQDTYTLLRKGIRKLLRALGYHLPGRRQGMNAATRQLVETYLDQDRKAAIDWSDPQQRMAQLQTLVTDAEAILELASEHTDDEQVRMVGWLLTKILGDDVQTDDQGHAQLGKGSAEDRVVSWTDPQMRHGRKSSAHRFAGYKASVSTELGSELIVDIADLPANAGDGQELMPSIERVEEHTSLTVERVIADGAYSTGDNRLACATHRGQPIDLVSPIRHAAGDKIDRAAFQVDVEARTATCPQGHTVKGHNAYDCQKRPKLEFVYPRSLCAACPLFARCVRSKTAGRTLTTHPYEALWQAARVRQQSEEFQPLYRLRSAVERKIAELVHHGLRHTRYVGPDQRRLQRLWLAAAVNLKRLFKLADERAQGQEGHVDLGALLAALRPQAGECAV